MTHPAFAKGRTAVITGAASGIGFAAAEAAAGFGMGVLMIDLPGPALEAAAERLAATGATVWAQGADVSDLSALEMIAAAAVDLPPVTFLMNNAGIQPASSTLGGARVWSRILGVNLWGVIHGTMAFSAGMMAHGEPALIVNTGSKQGITTPPGNPAYNVSKAGVKSYTETLAHELRNTEGCKVTAHLMIPGWVHTPLTAPPGSPKPAGAWLPAQAVEFMLASLDRGDFYILCPDNDVPRALDEKRIAWAAGDIIHNRPALSRWHPDHAEAFKAHLARD
ncbi:SDR family NAD(P)-dependent oxidoreductase [bacterium]|nr:SDR family NAD(P)-dependent oxidoreductase [bacterium]